MSCTKSTPRKYLINHSMILNRHLDVALHPDAVEFLAQPRDLARLVGRARPPALVGASAPARRWPRQVVPPPSAAKLAPADPAGSTPPPPVRSSHRDDRRYHIQLECVRTSPAPSVALVIYQATSGTHPGATLRTQPPPLLLRLGGCRCGCRLDHPRPALFTQSEAVAADGQHVAVVQQSVQDGGCHDLVAKHGAPVADSAVGGDENAAAL
jgi:hypothetical protein